MVEFLIFDYETYPNLFCNLNMQYLANRVSNSISVPFMVDTLKGRTLSSDDLRKIKDFTMFYEFHQYNQSVIDTWLSRFYADNEDVTDTWEDLEDADEDEEYGEWDTLWVIFKKHEDMLNKIMFDGRNMNAYHGLTLFLEIKEQLLECKNDIHKVFLSNQNWSDWRNNEMMYKIRQMILDSAPNVTS